MAGITVKDVNAHGKRNDISNEWTRKKDLVMVPERHAFEKKKKKVEIQATLSRFSIFWYITDHALPLKLH